MKFKRFYQFYSYAGFELIYGADVYNNNKLISGKKKDLDLRTKIVLRQFLKDRLKKVWVQPQSKQTWC